jgi:hypothetical protein
MIVGIDGYVGLSQVNVEPLQIVSYRPGQRFNLHHDAGTLLEDGSVPTMVPPRRLVTLFLVGSLTCLILSGDIFSNSTYICTCMYAVLELHAGRRGPH